MLESLAWLGTVFLVIRLLAQVLKTITEGHANGLSLLMILLWLGGAGCTLPYVVVTSNYPVAVAHGVNVCACVILLYYKLYPIITNEQEMP